MTTSMMAPMPATPNTITTSPNGRHPSPALTPPTRTRSEQAELDRRRAEARAERIRLIETKGRGVKWLLRVIYVVAVLVAGTGQLTGLVAKMHMPLLVALVFVGAVEGFAIGFAGVANFRRALGENAYVAYALATGFSGFAVVVNWWGHYDINPFLAGVFAVFSAAGFITFVIESAFTRRDSLWIQNKIDDPPPLYGLWITLTQPKLVARAKLHALTDPGLGPAGSLEAARKSLAADARRAAMQRIIRADLGRVLGTDNAHLMTSVIDPDQLADEISAQAQLGQLATIYARRIDPAQIEEAHAIERANRRRGLFGGARRTARVTTPTAPAGTAQPAPTPPAPARRRKAAAPDKRERLPAEVLLARSDELRAADPTRTWKDIAGQLGVSETRLGTVRRAAGRTSATD